MSDKNKNNSSSKKDTFFTFISNKVKSSFLWKKQFQMITLSFYNSLSCICTIVNRIINFNSKLPTIDIIIILALLIVLILNLLFIYGCYTSNKKFLKLTPVISCFILIFVFFPKWNAFFYLLSYFRFNETKIYKFIESMGSFSIVRIFVRYLFDEYSDEFIKETTNEQEEDAEEEAEAEKEEKEEEKEEKQDDKESEKTEKTEEKKESENHEEEEENTSQDPETKKNN
ncbi:hypothetical protein H8356DRAFT_1360410 [Neocallimastix lanati (nom. inval.)]|nr:hypothetical protein H8356DRAFT_1360410 [Neocallimastix sp. JGI-2020a]